MKWYSYIICFILIFVGTICGMRFYKEVKAKSYINGSINIQNQFTQESFNYSASELTFYTNDNTNYTFEKNLLKVEDFNGVKKNYEVLLNGKTILEPTINAGSVYANVTMNFYDTYGDLICTPTLSIEINFLSNKTVLKLSCVGTEEASFLEQYFSDNGIRLQINEKL
jgi:hypothetical protein